MKYSHLYKILLSVIILIYGGTVFAPVSLADEEKAVISEMVLTNTRDDLLLYFTVYKEKNLLNSLSKGEDPL